MSEPAYIHPTSEVNGAATIGDETKIWNWVQIREGVVIGKNCIISKGVYIDKDVSIGNLVKIQNNVSIFHGVNIGDGVFIGPHVCFTNDLHPRAVTKDFSPSNDSDWQVDQTFVGRGASIGANSTIIAGNSIGDFALIGAGSVVTSDIPSYALAYGNPARVVGEVNEQGIVVKRFS